jgi:hypothetical protein
VSAFSSPLETRLDPISRCSGWLLRNGTFLTVGNFLVPYGHLDSQELQLDDALLQGEGHSKRLHATAILFRDSLFLGKSLSIQEEILSSKRPFVAP